MLQGKRILVTGATGFLGYHVCRELVGRGAEVHPVHRGNGHDLTQEKEARAAFHLKHDVAIHLAARVGGIIANMHAPGTFFRDNMLMGMNVIEAARNANVRLVIIGTICSYPKYCPVPFKESDLWSGYPEETNAPYGIAKKALLTMAQAYRKEFGLKFCYLSPTNLYGPFDNFDDHSSHVIPAMIKKFIHAKDEKKAEVTLFGTGKPTRSFLYAADAAEAIALAAGSLDYDDIINLPGCDEISMRDLAALIRDSVEYKGKIVWDSSKPDGQPRRFIDGQRVKGLLKWVPSTSLEQGIKDTVAWYVSRTGAKE